MLDAPHTSIRSEKFKETIEKELGKENIEYVFDQDFGKTRESAANIVTNNIAKPVDIIWAAGQRGVWRKIRTRNSGRYRSENRGSRRLGSRTLQCDQRRRSLLHDVLVPPANIVETTLDTAKKYFEGDTDIPKSRTSSLASWIKNNISEYMKYVQ